MALDAGGRTAEARAGLRAGWSPTQRPDGAWHQYYLAGQVEEPTLDANVTAYVATGVWHHFLATGDAGFLDADVARRRAGHGLRARPADAGRRDHLGPPRRRHAVVVRPAHRLVEHLPQPAVRRRHRRAGSGHDRPDVGARPPARCAEAIAERPGAFLPKDRWAMDWYYPVLAGVVTGDAGPGPAGRRLGPVRHGRPGRPLRRRPAWVTAAETCECALAHLAAGETDRGRSAVPEAASHLRAPTGAGSPAWSTPSGTTSPPASARPTAPPRRPGRRRPGRRRPHPIGVHASGRASRRRRPSGPRSRRGTPTPAGFPPPGRSTWPTGKDLPSHATALGPEQQVGDPPPRARPAAPAAKRHMSSGSEMPRSRALVVWMRCSVGSPPMRTNAATTWPASPASMADRESRRHLIGVS